MMCIRRLAGLVKRLVSGKPWMIKVKFGDGHEEFYAADDDGVVCLRQADPGRRLDFLHDRCMQVLPPSAEDITMIPVNVDGYVHWDLL